MSEIRFKVRIKRQDNNSQLVPSKQNFQTNYSEMRNLFLVYSTEKSNVILCIIIFEDIKFYYFNLLL